MKKGSYNHGNSFINSIGDSYSEKGEIREENYLNFTMYDYLSLTKDRLRRDDSVKKGTNQEVIDALSALKLHEEAEEYLIKIYKKPLILSKGSIQAHFDVLPAIIGLNDAIIIDSQTHTSLSLAGDILKNYGTHVENLEHNRMDMLEDRIKLLKSRYKKVWYLANGVYSTYGDTLPINPIITFLEKYKQFHLYTDDSYGMSWIGENGKGFVFHHIPNHPRIIQSISLRNGFGAEGRVTVCFDDKIKAKITRITSKQINNKTIFNPTILEAVIESSKIHLSPEIYRRQTDLRERIDLFNNTAIGLGLPVMNNPCSPIGFIAAGKPDMCHELQVKLMKNGFYTCGAQFPELALANSGIRIIIGLHQSKDDIKNLLVTLKEEYIRILRQRNLTMDCILKNYRVKDQVA